jgi:hypothetical protein
VGTETRSEVLNVQEAPFPTDLQELVDECELDPGWRVALVDMDRGQGSKGLTLSIVVQVFDSYHPDRGRNYRVQHLFPVPAASYNQRSWTRWLFDRYLEVLQHEGQEMFKVGGIRPYAPRHGPGNDPYVIPELATREEQRERFDAEDPREKLGAIRDLLAADTKDDSVLVSHLRQILWPTDQ